MGGYFIPGVYPFGFPMQTQFYGPTGPIPYADLNEVGKDHFGAAHHEDHAEHGEHEEHSEEPTHWGRRLLLIASGVGLIAAAAALKNKGGTENLARTSKTEFIRKPARKIKEGFHNTRVQTGHVIARSRDPKFQQRIGALYHQIPHPNYPHIQSYDDLKNEILDIYNNVTPIKDAHKEARMVLKDLGFTRGDLYRIRAELGI